MSATGTRDDVRPLLSTNASLYGTMSSSAPGPLREKLLKFMKGHGSAQVVLGVFSFILGLILSLSLSLWQDADENFPHWAGGLLFTGFGVISVLAARYPRPGLILFIVLLNLAALMSAVVIILLHITYLLRTEFWSCEGTEPYPSQLRENCELGKNMYQMVFTLINNMLIGFSTAQIVYSMMVMIIGIRVWGSFRTSRNQSPEAPQQHTPA